MKATQRTELPKLMSGQVYSNIALQAQMADAIFEKASLQSTP